MYMYALKSHNSLPAITVLMHSYKSDIADVLHNK